MTETTFQRARRKAARTFLLAGSLVLALQLAGPAHSAVPRLAVLEAHSHRAGVPDVWRVVTTTCPAIGSVVRDNPSSGDVSGLQESSMLQTYWVAWAQHHPGVFATVALYDGPTLISVGAGDCAWGIGFGRHAG